HAHSGPAARHPHAHPRRGRGRAAEPLHASRHHGVHGAPWPHAHLPVSLPRLDLRRGRRAPRRVLSRRVRPAPQALPRPPPRRPPARRPRAPPGGVACGGFVFATRGAVVSPPPGPPAPATRLIDRSCDLSPEGEVELTARWVRHRCPANWKMLPENDSDGYHL